MARKASKQVMKRQLMTLLVMLGLLIGMGTAKAQVNPVFGEIRANVPFEFHAGSTRFPAGNYVIKRLNESDPRILTISPVNGGATSMMMVHLQDNKVESKANELVFNKYGSRFFLSSIAIAGYSNGNIVDKSQFEEVVSKGETPGEGRRVPASRGAKK